MFPIARVLKPEIHRKPASANWTLTLNVDMEIGCKIGLVKGKYSNLIGEGKDSEPTDSG